MCIHIYTCRYTYIHIYISTYVYTYIYIYIYIYRVVGHEWRNQQRLKWQSAHQKSENMDQQGGDGVRVVDIGWDAAFGFVPGIMCIYIDIHIYMYIYIYIYIYIYTYIDIYIYTHSYIHICTWYYV